MALNDIRVPKENAQATFDEIALAPADIGAVASNDARLTDARTPLSHTHGNLTNAGAIGTTSGLPVKTGTSGVLEAGAFGTAAGQFAEGNHTHTAADISSGVLDLARQKIVELVPCDDDPANELDVSAYEQNGNIVAHFNLRADAEDPQIAVLLPDLASTAIGEVTLRVNRGGGQSLEFTSVFIEVFDEADEQIFGTSEGTLEVDADEELTFRWNNGRWDLDLRPNPLATTTAVSIFKPNASGTLALTSDIPKNLWIPASAWIPKTTAGCGVDSRDTTTNDQNFDELLFDTGTDEFADALVVMPSNYNNGTVTARFYWTAASGSGGVAWAIQGRAFANDDALDTAAGTAQLVTDTLIAADDMHITSATSAVTIGGTPAANTPIQFTIYRDVSDAADDLAVDARLLGVEIIFN
jgi:hypothetical protein